MTPTFQPCKDKLLVTLLPLPGRSTSLQVIERETTTRRATVLRIGPDVRDIAEGDTVLVSTLAGQTWDDDQLILPQASVWAVLESP